MGKKGEETKQNIRNSAMVLFAKKGFKEVTMQDICAAAGISRGGLYLHYNSTQQIFAQIIESMMSSQDDEFSREIQERVPAALILEQVLERYKKEMIDSEHSLSIAIYEYFSGQEQEESNALLKEYERSFSSWKKLIEYGIETKEFNPINIESVFHMLIFSYQGVRMYSKLMPIDEKIPEQIISQIKALLLANGGK